MSNAKLIFQYVDLQDDSLWVLEDNDNIILYLNSKSITLTKGKAKELLQSLILLF